MIKIVSGNILEAKEAIIAHQVNCQGVMGATKSSRNLAAQIRAKYPEVYESYVEYCKGCKDGDPKTLLGQIQTVPCHDGKIIANLFGQFNYGTDKQQTDYMALKEAMLGLSIIATLCNDSIAMPYGIGCGLAGGDWNTVYSIIEEVFKCDDVTLYKWEG